MTGRPTRWGIISAGKISSDFCIALRTLPRTEHEIVAVAARKLDDAEAFAKRHGVKKAYGSYESLAADPDVEIAYIGSIHPKHCEQSLMLLEAGKHVLCEKPMGMSAAETKKILKAAKEKKLFFAEGFWSRHFPAYDQLRQELAANPIGDIRLVSVDFGFAFDWETVERVAKKECGGGVILDIGCYGIQLASLVFKKERPERIVANGVLYSTGVDRSVSVTLFYKGGRMAQILITGDSLLSNTAHIYGTTGTLTLPNFWCPSELKTPSKTFSYPLPEPPEKTHFTNSVGFVYQINSVRKALLEGKTEVSQIDHEDSLLIAEIQDEILRQVGVAYD